MRKARFTEHQIIAVLKSVEAGRTVKDVCQAESGMPGTEGHHRKKFLKPEIKRELVSYLTTQFTGLFTLLLGFLVFLKVVRPFFIHARKK